MSRHLLTEGQN